MKNSKRSVERRYTLGPSPLMRETRSGKSAGRLDLGLDGHLDTFLTPPEEQRHERSA